MNVSSVAVGARNHDSSSFSLVVATLILVGSLVYLLNWSTRKKLKFPPGPPSWPFIGSLPYLEPPLHKALKKLSDIHGGIMYLKFGVHPCVVISSVEAVERLFKISDVDFAHRLNTGPFDTTAQHVGFGGRDLALSSYNNHFKALRKLCATEIFSVAKLSQSQHTRKEIINQVIENISANTIKRELTNLKVLFRKQQVVNISQLLFGNQVKSVNSGQGGDGVSDSEKFNSYSNTTSKLFGAFNFADMMSPAWLQPTMQWLDPQGIGREWKNIVATFSDSLTRIIDEHRQIQIESNATGKGFERDFLHTLLLEGNGKIDNDSAIAVCSDLIVASIDTSSTLLTWIFVYLLRHPECLRKLQAEIDSVVGQDRVLEEKDIPNMPYLEAVVKETLRIRPPLPTMLPRTNHGPKKFAGYDIPSNSMVIINFYAIAQDPSVWKNPEDFMPERFLGNKGNFPYAGTNYKFIPFGSGRRGCVGLNLAVVNVSCTLGSILHALEISLPPHMSPEDVSVEEDTYPLVLSPAHPPCITSKRRPAYVNYTSLSIHLQRMNNTLLSPTEHLTTPTSI